MKGTTKRPIQVVRTWVRRQPPKVKVFLGFVCAIAALIFIRMVVYDHDNLFIAAEAVHALGISVLIYKLATEKTCAGLSLKSQELTAIFLGSRLYCSFVMEYDVHTLLDLATLAATVWVVYMMRFNLNASYMHEKDNVANYYVVIPCALLSLVIHPSTQHYIVNRILWAFCVYLEAVSVLPQLRVMQNTKIVEPFTAHYVFALGVARFLSCAHWILQVSRNLFRWTKEMAYADYYERALINGVLSIQRGKEPEVMIYMLPLAPGASKATGYHKWGSKFNDFWCCYGTGIESFSKLGDSIYFEEAGNSHGLYVIQYISSSLDWKSGKVFLTQKVEPAVSWDPHLRVRVTISPKKLMKAKELQMILSCSLIIKVSE